MAPTFGKVALTASTKISLSNDNMEEEVEGFEELAIVSENGNEEISCTGMRMNTGKPWFWSRDEQRAEEWLMRRMQVENFIRTGEIILAM